VILKLKLKQLTKNTVQHAHVLLLVSSSTCCVQWDR